MLVNIFSIINDTTIPFVLYDTETHVVFLIFRSCGLMFKKMAIPSEKVQCVNGSSRRDPTRKFSVISVQGMEGIHHRGLLSESGTRGLRRLQVVRNRKVPVVKHKCSRC